MKSENAISEIITQSDITKDDWDAVSYLLAGILTTFFSLQEKESGLRSWSVDDMYPDEVEQFSKKVSLRGSIFWLGGGGECVYYQADIALNTNPLLYSYKLQNKRPKQIMYIGKTFNGWILNAQ